MKPLHQLPAGIFSICLLVGTGTALESEPGKSEEPSTSQATISLEEAIGIAKEVFPGKVLEADFEHEDGKAVYEIEIASNNGEVMELKVDAQSGEVLSNELEAQNAHEQEKSDKNDDD